MKRLDSKRKGEITMILAERLLGKRAFPIGNDLLREAHSLAQKAGVTPRQALFFFREIYVCLHNAVFPELPVRNNFTPSDDLKAYGFEGGRDKIAMAYVEAEVAADLFLNKGRINKFLASVSDETKVDQDELKSYFGEVSGSLFQTKIYALTITPER